MDAQDKTNKPDKVQTLFDNNLVKKVDEQDHMC
jgi:hypothetical protein